MKKFVALVSAALCGAMVLTGCSKITANKVEKDPAAQVAQSMENTFDSTIKESPAAVVGTFLDKGKIHIRIEGDDNVAEGWADLASTPKFAFSIDADDGDLKGWINTDEIVFESEEFFDGEAYGIKLKNFEDNYNDSELSDMDVMEGFDDDIGDEAMALISNFGKEYKTLKKEFEDAKKATYAAFKEGDFEVTTEKIDVNDGEVNAIVLEYEITPEIIEGVLEAGIDAFSELTIFETLDIDLDKELPDTDYIMEEVEYFFDNLGADSIPVTIAINKKTGDFIYACVELELEVEGESETVSFEIDLGKEPAKSEEWVFTFKEGDSEEEFVLTKIFEKNNVEIAITEKASGDQPEFTPIKLTIEDGEFEIVREYKDWIWDDDYEDYEIEIVEETVAEGTCSYSAKKLELGFEIDGEDYTILIDTDGVPGAPGFNNLLKMDEDELEDLFDDIGFGGGSKHGVVYEETADDDWDYYDEDDWDYAEEAEAADEAADW